MIIMLIIIIIIITITIIVIMIIILNIIFLHRIIRNITILYIFHHHTVILLVIVTIITIIITGIVQHYHIIHSFPPLTHCLESLDVCKNWHSCIHLDTENENRSFELILTTMKDVHPHIVALMSHHCDFPRIAGENFLETNRLESLPEPVDADAEPEPEE